MTKKDRITFTVISIIGVAVMVLGWTFVWYGFKMIHAVITHPEFIGG